LALPIRARNHRDFGLFVLKRAVIVVQVALLSVTVVPAPGDGGLLAP